MKNIIELDGKRFRIHRFILYILIKIVFAICFVFSFYLKLDFKSMFLKHILTFLLVPIYIYFRTVCKFKNFVFI